MSQKQVDEHVLRISQGMLPPADLEGFVDRYAYIRNGSRVVDLLAPPQDAVMSKDDFFNLVARAVVEKKGTRNAVTIIPIARMWMSASKRLTVTDTMYYPDAPEKNFLAVHGSSYYNTFNFPQHEEIEDAILPSPARAHLEYIFGDEVERALDYFAHIIQKPEERPSWVPLNVARSHGTGRGWIDQMMIRVLGPWNCSTTKIKPLVDASTGGFSNFYDDTLWCNIPEIKVESGARFEVDDKLRDVLTDKHMLINPKYGRQAFKRVYARTFLCSNHLDGLLIPKEDRRIWATMVAGDPQPESAYDHLYAHLEDSHFVARIFHYLKQRDISGFNASGRAPMTAAKQQIIALTHSEPESAFATIPDSVEVATTDQVMGLAGVHDADSKRRMRAVLKAKCGLYLANDKDGRLKWNGKPEKVWILKRSAHWMGASREEVRVALDAVQQRLDADEMSFEDFI